MGFGDIIKSKRRKLKISQRELASKININFTYISKIENGIFPPPSEKTIKDICDVLELDFINTMLVAKKIPTEFEELIFNNKEISEYLKSKIS